MLLYYIIIIIIIIIMSIIIIIILVCVSNMCMSGIHILKLYSCGEIINYSDKKKRNQTRLISFLPEIHFNLQHVHV